MTEDKNLQAAYDCLCHRDLVGVITNLYNYLVVHSQQDNMERLYAVKTDFQLMSDYWKRGFKDPLANDLFDNLLRRLYVLYANIAQAEWVRSTAVLNQFNDHFRHTSDDWSLALLKSELENQVSNLALLELEPEHTSDAKRKDYYSSHHQLMGTVFMKLVVSPLMTAQEAEYLEEVLLAPTIDSNDQQTLVSAVTLSGTNFFDIHKFLLLLHVYQKAVDSAVRQRALVGWVLMSGSDVLASVYVKELAEVEKLLEEEAVCQELIQLQQQIVFCLNAKKDNETIQKEIMPDLLSNSNLRVTRNGIEEVEEDALNDILHPDEEERRMEQLEESIMRMQTMQQQGSDVYYAGFSQMKRFPFFSELVNWFVPFYIEHPGLTEVIEQFRSYKFVRMLLDMGPFCNSDKYSFLMAFVRVFERLPESLRNLLLEGHPVMPEALTEEFESDAYIRRSYLQDLYRFYRLYPHRQKYADPFSQVTSIFFANPIFSKTHLEAHFNDIAAFLIKKQRMEDAGIVLANCGEARRDFRYEMMGGYLAQHGYYQVADAGPDGIDSYRRALRLQPENELALRGCARALLKQAQYEEALRYYDQLLTLYPGKRSYLLNRAICQMHLKRYQEAEKDLYRLNYEKHDDVQVNRVLAWTLTCDGKYEQAQKIYSQLLTDSVQTEDLLNYGYCLWLSGNVNDAADCFHRYLKESGETASVIIASEFELLQEKGITEAEMQMMLYIA